MKSTGIVRQIDHLGRIVLPKELRTTFEINDRDPIEIFVDGNDIILRKHLPACVFCGSRDKTTFFKEKILCGRCLFELSSISSMNS